MKPVSRWKIYLSRIIAFFGVLIAVGILGTIGYFQYDNMQIDKMTARFRDELARDPDAFAFVERNSGFFFLKLSEAQSPFRECLGVDRHPKQKGLFAIHSGEEFESGSLERAATALRKIRSTQDCPAFTALYFKGGFRRVSVRMNIDAEGRLTKTPEFHVYD